MFMRSTSAPVYAYALAVVAGLLVSPTMYALGILLGDVREPDAYIMMWPIFWATFAFIHAALGVVFGMVWPRASWRWGVWVSAAPLCVLSFLTPGAAFYAGWALVTLLPSSACARAVASYALKSAAAGRTW